jgi:hypothetical protein
MRLVALWVSILAGAEVKFVVGPEIMNIVYLFHFVG